MRVEWCTFLQSCSSGRICRVTLFEKLIDFFHRLQAEINSVSLELLELKGVLPGANESNTGANLSNAGNVSLSNAHLTATLQQQIRLLTEEKDNALELATSANTELDILQKEYKVISNSTSKESSVVKDYGCLPAAVDQFFK